MSNNPAELKYAKSHEWARLEEDGSVTVGITEHAQEALGDVVYVETPAIGDAIAGGDQAGVVESVKAASDVYSPVSGEVVEINEALGDAPGKVNEGAYTEGWMMKVKMSDPSEVDALMDAAAYEASCDQ